MAVRRLSRDMELLVGEGMSLASSNWPGVPGVDVPPAAAT